jgi:hypothetical protein
LCWGSDRLFFFFKFIEGGGEELFLFFLLNMGEDLLAGIRIGHVVVLFVGALHQLEV